MPFSMRTEIDAPWLIPYAYGIVFMGFLFFLYRAFEFWYATQFNKLLFRQLFAYKKLNATQLQLLENNCEFYSDLTSLQKRQFRHRVAIFVSRKRFIGRENFVIDERVKILIACSACILSFGRKNYCYGLVDSIVVFPHEFYSEANQHFHKFEFNPSEKVVVFSWQDFYNGFHLQSKLPNIGTRGFAYALQLEATQGNDSDSVRFSRQFQNILKHLLKSGVKEKLSNTPYFQSFSFANQFEFMALLTEYFLKSPQEFKTSLPELYKHQKILLNFNFLDY